MEVVKYFVMESFWSYSIFEWFKVVKVTLHCFTSLKNDVAKI